MNLDLCRWAQFPPVSILIPTHGAVEALHNCLASLERFTAADSSIHVLDDGTLDHSVRSLCEQFATSLHRLEYLRSETHLGFVGACNWGCASICKQDADVLLLKPNTEVTAGFLEELQSVLYLHERHGVACPRSNNGEIFSIPVEAPGLDARHSYSVWQRIKHLLPRYQIVPTAASFCMLIKAGILKRFGLFNPDYAPECNEAHDFACRINRHGYSVVAANCAYVQHHEPRPCEAVRGKLKQQHNDTLQFRCPEYEQKTANYKQFHRDPMEEFASLYLPHRPRILYDLFHLVPAHTGTSEVGLNLLRELARIVKNEFELFVGVDPSQHFFANELSGYRTYEDQAPDRKFFDLVFKPCQILSWTEFGRMVRVSPRVSYCMLDIIGLRCDYLNSIARQILLQTAAELSDCVFTISNFARSDFAAFYGADVSMRAIHLGTNFGMTRGEFRRGQYVLVVGNDFAHKGIRQAVEQLDSSLPVVVVGSAPDDSPPNIRWLPSGTLTRQHIRELFADARVVVYPSQYEGFGLPIVDALALGKPTVVLDTAINRELAATLCDPNLHRIGSIGDLRSAVAALFDTEPSMPAKEPRRWRDVAEEYAGAFRELLSRDFDPAKVRSRWQMLRTVESSAHSVSSAFEKPQRNDSAAARA